MGIVINGNVGNIQNNEGISMANQNNILFYTESDSTLNPQSIQQDVNQIKEKVVAGEFDGYFEGENDELEALFEKVHTNDRGSDCVHFHSCRMGSRT